MPQNETTINTDQLKKFQQIIMNSNTKRDKHTILIVDDEIDNLQLLKRTLRKEYNILSAQNGSEAFEIVEKHGQQISLIISDQRMPLMSGTEFLAKTVTIYPHIIKMLLTGYSDVEAMIDGVNNCNLFQYITKPFDIDDLMHTVKSGIDAYELTMSKNILLGELKDLFFNTIKSISSALDAKDTYTHGHSLRVTLYSLMIASELGLDEAIIEDLETSGLLHDIGKIGVPRNIICKPGKLTDEEYNVMKQHPELGTRILTGIKRLDSATNWLNNHHERWDGRGYPLGLNGENIPLPARILAIADTYDAMTSDRSYRKGLPHQIAAEEIRKCAGSQFDPALSEIFEKIEKEIEQAKENTGEYYRKFSRLSKYLNQ